MMVQPDRHEMEQAFRERNASYDGLFYIGVKTTGVFCRPSCPARRPLPQNVEYLVTAREALFSGYRPCRRCHPLESAGAIPGWLRPVLAHVEEDPSARVKDADLAAMGLDPAKVRRFFLARFGLTFQAYSRARRLARAFDDIKAGGKLDDAILGHGFESHSGFRDAFARWSGGPPGQTRQGDYIRLAWIETPLGPMVAGATGAGVCLLEFSDRRMLETQLDTLARRVRLPLAPGEHPHLETLRAELSAYFTGRLQRFTLPLVYPGTDFQIQVWRRLLEIPYGQTRSYEDIACDLGRSGAARAVGVANGSNRIAVVVPCHRVVNKSGELGGYGGGLWRKRHLLELERAFLGK